MDPSTNPYAAPQTDFREPAPARDGDIDPQVVESLQQTRPWVLVVSVAGGLSAVGLVLWNLLLVGAILQDAGNRLFLLAAVIANGFFVLVLGVGVWRLRRYSRAIARLVREPRVELLRDAVAAQRSVWRLFGMAILVIAATYAAGLILLILAILFGSPVFVPLY